MIVPVLEQLIATTGTQAKPVDGLSITGVNFRDAAAVYEEQWEVPSGGDWALHRSGAIFLEGTTNAKVSGGLFKRLDGNAIMLNGFNRAATIEKNEFVYIADNVLAGVSATTLSYLTVLLRLRGAFHSDEAVLGRSGVRPRSGMGGTATSPAAQSSRTTSSMSSASSRSSPARGSRH